MNSRLLDLERSTFRVWKLCPASRPPDAPMLLRGDGVRSSGKHGVVSRLLPSCNCLRIRQVPRSIINFI